MIALSYFVLLRTDATNPTMTLLVRYKQICSHHLDHPKIHSANQIGNKLDYHKICSGDAL